MKFVKLPTGDVVLDTGTDAEVAAHESLIERRHRFNLKYMKERGWGDDVDALTLEQIMVIRSQPGWKEPK